MMIDLPSLSVSRQVGKYNPFGLGFRPFFLLTSVWAVVAVMWWALWLFGVTQATPYAGMVVWHQHEMLIGLGSAIAAGFLLTAVRNWTKLKTPTGSHLAAMAGVWLLGRVAWWLGDDVLPVALIVLLDGAFLPWLLWTIGYPIWRRKQWNQWPFLAVLSALLLANLLFYGATILALGSVSLASGVATYALLSLLLVMGGRIIPFFTERGCHLSLKSPPVRLSQSYFSLLVLLAVLDLTHAFAPILSIVSVSLAVLLLLQMYYWQSWRTHTNPLVWILHLGYAGLVLGFLLKSLAMWRPDIAALSIHAWMMIGLGGIGFGMMARVSLGHSGRVLETLPGMQWAFVLVIIAGVSRLFTPVSAIALQVAVTLWVAAFLLLLWRYVPVWLRSRIDDQPD